MILEVKSRPGINWARAGGASLFAGGLVFVIFNTIAESIYPGYNVGHDALSNLGAIGVNTRFLWDGQLFVSGLLSLIGVALFFFRSKALDISRRNVVSIFYILPTLGAITVSLFPENYNTTVHTIGAFITFVFGGIIAIYSGRFIKSPFRYFSIILGLITLISLSQISNSALGFGEVERLVVYPVVLWELTFGTYLMQQ